MLKIGWLSQLTMLSGKLRRSIAGRREVVVLIGHALEET